jgi:hypothetical protein
MMGSSSSRGVFGAWDTGSGSDLSGSKPSEHAFGHEKREPAGEAGARDAELSGEITESR